MVWCHFNQIGMMLRFYEKLRDIWINLRSLSNWFLQLVDPGSYRMRMSLSLFTTKRIIKWLNRDLIEILYFDKRLNRKYKYVSWTNVNTAMNQILLIERSRLCWRVEEVGRETLWWPGTMPKMFNCDWRSLFE